MVGTGILPKHTRFPSPECNTAIWRMNIYSDTLQWWDITSISYPLLIWTLLPNLTFYIILWDFHRLFATGAACHQRTFTPPDTWSCPTLGLAYVLMSRPISPELVLFPDLWVSNIPRYFFFASLVDLVSYGRYGDLIEQYGITLSRMLNDILTLDQQWLPYRSDFPPISWPLYRAWPSPNYELFPWSICNGCG